MSLSAGKLSRKRRFRLELSVYLYILRRLSAVKVAMSIRKAQGIAKGLDPNRAR